MSKNKKKENHTHNSGLKAIQFLYMNKLIEKYDQVAECY